MKKFTLTLLILVAIILLPSTASASPGDQPGWSNLADSWHSLWNLIVDLPTSLWQEGGTMIDPVGRDDDQDGQDEEEILSIIAPGGPMIDPVGLTPPIPAAPEMEIHPFDAEDRDR